MRARNQPLSLDASKGRDMGRPTTSILTRDGIVDAAVRLIDREGSEAVSMRRIASLFGVAPSSLYNHIGSRLELIEEVRTRICGSIDGEAFSRLPWEDAVRVWAHSYRDAFAAHPRSIPLLMSWQVRSPAILRVHERFTRGALAAGWPEEEIVRMLTAYESFILGSVLDMSGPSVLFDPSGQENEVPAFASAVARVNADDLDDPVAGPAFELGLAALVRGLAR